MDGQLRAYVWGQVFAAKMSIHGFAVSDAAREADEALKEFDKRVFDTDEADEVTRLTVENAQLRNEIAQRQNEVIAPLPVVTSVSK